MFFDQKPFVSKSWSSGFSALMLFALVGGLSACADKDPQTAQIPEPDAQTEVEQDAIYGHDSDEHNKVDHEDLDHDHVADEVLTDDVPASVDNEAEVLDGSEENEHVSTY